MGRDESEALYILEINRQIIHDTVEQYNGQSIKEIGDGTLSTFHSTVDALACANNILKSILKYPKLNLRIALHLGDIIHENKDVFGDGVNITSRLESLAPCNGIAISQHFYAQVQGKTNYKFKSIGFPHLKNITSKIEVFTWQPNYNQNGVLSNVEDSVISISRLPQKLIRCTHIKGVKTAAVIVLLILASYLLLPQQWLKDYLQKITMQQTNPVHESSIAVLKFKNIGDSLRNQYFSNGLSEELLNLLSRIKELRVASRTSTWALPENVTTAMVREQLNVNYMVEGSIRKSNDNVRITVQLIETKTGFHLWSDTYDRKLDDALAIQDEIALKITKSLKLLLSAQSKKAISSRHQVDAGAYEYYLKAKQFIRQPKTTTNLLNAIEFFNKAIAIENTFELAQAGLCQSTINYYNLTLATEDFKSAEINCLTILSAQTYQSEIYNGLGDLYLMSGRLKDAEENYQAALTLDLSSANALLGLAQTAENASDYINAEKYYLRTIQVDRNYSGAHEKYGNFLFYQGRYPAAINEFEKVISLNPIYGEAYNSLGAAFFANGNMERGVEIFQKSLTINETPEAYSNLGTAFFIEKKYELAAQMYEKAIELSPNSYMYYGFLAESYEHLPTKKSQTIEAYSKAINLAKQVLVVNRNDNEVLTFLAMYYSKINNRIAAINILTELETKELVSGLLYTMSVSYLSLNDHESALNVLEKAIDKGYDKSLVYSDENFSKLYKNKRLKEITTK